VEAPPTAVQDEPAAPPIEAETKTPSVPDSADTADEPVPDTVIALNVPKPDVPAADSIGQLAQRVSWLRDYRGGDCFYASATSATDKAMEIEGFGTDVDPFMGLLESFQAKFKMEPDVSVRLIEPAQCEVTKFLHTLGANVAEKPTLQLDRTSVPSGFPISGTLETMGGLRSSLLLIDHKGMVFNLDDRIAVQSGKGIFSIPIGLGASDQAAKKIVPQLLIAVTAPADIDATVLSKPAPATIVLPQILDEIKAKGLAASATAKYFQLGG
jgi:serine/threonine-protein kinase